MCCGVVGDSLVGGSLVGGNLLVAGCRALLVYGCEGRCSMNVLIPVDDSALMQCGARDLVPGTFCGAVFFGLQTFLSVLSSPTAERMCTSTP